MSSASVRSQADFPVLWLFRAAFKTFKSISCQALFNVARHPARFSALIEEVRGICRFTHKRIVDGLFITSFRLALDDLANIESESSSDV